MLSEEYRADLERADVCFLPLEDRKDPRGPLVPGDMIVHADDVEAVGMVAAAYQDDQVHVVWSRPPTLTARQTAANKREEAACIARHWRIFDDMFSHDEAAPCADHE